MQEIKKVGVLSVARIALLFGLLFGVIYVLMAKAVFSLNPEIAAMSGMVAFDWTQGLITILWMGVIYFLAGLICSGLYNLFVKWVGGVKVDLAVAKEKSTKKKK